MKKILQRMDKPILLISIIMFAFGLIMVLSASSMESYMRYGFSPYHYFIRQAIFLGVGIIPFIFIIVFPTSKYKHLINLAMFGIVGLLIGLTVWGSVAKNAQS